MKTFLGNVVRSLYSHLGGGIASISMVLPNMRSRLFFIDELAQVISAPVWQPACISIDDLMERVAGIGLIDRTRAIVELYKVWQQFHDEDFDHFYFWGEILLDDFDQIDKYMVDADALFGNISDLKRTGSEFDYLNEDQRTAIARFWGTFSSGARSDEKDRFEAVWHTLGDVYHAFRQSLSEQGAGYAGMIHRQAAEKIRSDREVVLEGSFAVVGFNALTRCEQILFDALQRSGNAVFFWDYDNYYIENMQQEAGRFLRDNIERYPQPDYFENGTDNFSRSKNIRAVALASDSMQCKYAATFVEEVLARQGSVGKETAIILTDEKLLVPLLYSIPESVRDINVTMGYPLRQSLAYSFTERLLKLQCGRKERGGETVFYHSDVTGLLSHPFVVSQCGKEAEAIRAEIIRTSRVHVKSSAFAGTALLAKIFTPQRDWNELVEYLIDILSDIAHHDSGMPPKDAEAAHEENAEAAHEGNDVLQYGADVTHKDVQPKSAGAVQEYVLAEGLHSTHGGCDVLPESADVTRSDVPPKNVKTTHGGDDVLQYGTIAPHKDVLQKTGAVQEYVLAEGLNFTHGGYDVLPESADAMHRDSDASPEGADTMRGGVLQREFLGHIVETLRRLANSLKNCGVNLSLRVASSLARRMLQSVRVPYTGEPLRGLQIMGILETRNLDFENVLILSMYDDNYPGNTSTSSSFVPYNLRYAYGLPTPQYNDGALAYYFYRLLQRASRVDMAYSSAADEESNGEPSRYIYQIEYESPHKIGRRNIGLDVESSYVPPIAVSKTPAIMKRLLRYTGDSRAAAPPSCDSAAATPIPGVHREVVPTPCDSAAAVPITGVHREAVPPSRDSAAAMPIPGVHREAVPPSRDSAATMPIPGVRREVVPTPCDSAAAVPITGVHREAVPPSRNSAATMPIPGVHRAAMPSSCNSATANYNATATPPSDDLGMGDSGIIALAPGDRAAVALPPDGHDAVDGCSAAVTQSGSNRTAAPPSCDNAAADYNAAAMMPSCDLGIAVSASRDRIAVALPPDGHDAVDGCSAAVTQSGSNRTAAPPSCDNAAATPPSDDLGIAVSASDGCTRVTPPSIEHGVGAPLYEKCLAAAAPSDCRITLVPPPCDCAATMPIPSVHRAVTPPSRDSVAANHNAAAAPPSADRRTAMSPSAFNAYLDCPLKFYFRSVARLKVDDEVAEEIDALMFGSILHKAMELLYSPLLGAASPAEEIAKMANSAAVDRAADDAIREVYFNGEDVRAEEYEGNTLLVRDIVRKYINNNILPFDSRQGDFTIAALECELESSFEFDSGEHLPRTILFRGTADRIDLLPDGKIRIIDYKTGSPQRDFAALEELMGEDAAKRNGAVLQTFLYSLMAAGMQRRGELEGTDVCPALYYVRMMNANDYSPLLNHQPVGQVESYSDYSEELEVLLKDKLKELFDPSVPFVQCKSTLPCRYCDFNAICGRLTTGG